MNARLIDEYSKLIRDSSIFQITGMICLENVDLGIFLLTDSKTDDNSQLFR
jgi:hypothetical protein